MPLIDNFQTTYAVILAGGSGTRFWPKSRQTMPKQLCKIGDAELTMIEKTLERLEGLVPPERRIVVTHASQLDATRQCIGAKAASIIAEPDARNTAAALTLAALEIEALHRGKSGVPVMVSLHADHLIREVQKFQTDLTHAIEVAKLGYLTLLGIRPTSPATGFGYIEMGTPISEIDGKDFAAFRVSSFREKPDHQRALQYVESGKFLWNSGYFIWRVDSFLAELSTHLPETLKTLQDVQKKSNKLFRDLDAAVLAPSYAKLPKIAVDHAILEVSEKVAVIPARFDWHDVGSWDALEHCLAKDAQGNIAQGDVMLLDCRNVIVDASSKFVAVIGVEDLVIVQTDDAILVCPKARAQDVKNIVEELKARGRTGLI